MTPQLLDTEGAAAYTGMAKSTLEKRRVFGQDPKFVKLGGRAVRYRVADLDEWINKSVVTSTSQKAA